MHQFSNPLLLNSRKCRPSTIIDHQPSQDLMAISAPFFGLTNVCRRQKFIDLSVAIDGFSWVNYQLHHFWKKKTKIDSIDSLQTDTKKDTSRYQRLKMATTQQKLGSRKPTHQTQPQHGSPSLAPGIFYRLQCLRQRQQLLQPIRLGNRLTWERWGIKDI